MFNSLKTKIVAITKMCPHEFYFLFEAILFLAAARFCVYFFPLKWYIDKLGSDKPDSLVQDKVNPDIILIIHRAISRATKVVPWNTACLPQAIAAKWMCRKRNIKSVLYLGVAKKANSTSSEQGLNVMFREHSSISAHAWLKVEDTIITGGVGHKKFTVLKKLY